MSSTFMQATAMPLTVAALLMCAGGCSSRIYQYSFKTQATPTSFTAPPTAPATAALEAQKMGVLLIPEGVWVGLPSESVANKGSRVAFEAQGPMRLFVRPGHHTLNVNLIAELDDDAKKRPAWSVEQTFGIGEAYTIVAEEGVRQVDWQLLQVSPSVYSELHAGDRFLPTIGN